MTDELARLARRLTDAGYDPRHAVLDLTADLLALESHAAALPPGPRDELRAVLAEVRAVQPTYPSRRLTSPFFDRAGLGRLGLERADRLVRRIVALAAAVQATP